MKSRLLLLLLSLILLSNVGIACSNDLDAEHVLIVTTVSGTLHGLSMDTGQVMWTCSSPVGALVSSFNARDSPELAIPSPDGSIVVLSEGALKRLPLTASELVDQSPISVGDGQTMIVADKRSTIFNVDARSGSLLQAPGAAPKLPGAGEEDLLDEERSTDGIWIGSAEFRVRMLSPSGQEMWNVTITELAPLRQARRGSSYKIPSFSTTVNGQLTAHRGSNELWSTVLDSIVISGWSSGTRAKVPVQQVEAQTESFVTIHPLSDNQLFAMVPTATHCEKFAQGTRWVHNLLFDSSMSGFLPSLSAGDKMRSPWRSRGQFSCEDEANISSCLIGAHALADQHYYPVVGVVERGPVEGSAKMFFHKVFHVFVWVAPVPLLWWLVKRCITRRGTNGNGVGSIRVLKDEPLLGRGSYGTKIYAGFFGERSVAVKRMDRDLMSAAHREISLLIKGDGHPNVIRYFAHEMRGEYVFLALERCEASLAQTITAINVGLQSNTPLKGVVSETISSETLRKSLLGLVEGLAHLHALKIIHRDIKPQNVLLPDGSLKHMKLADMGLSKLLAEDQSSFGHLSEHSSSLRLQRDSSSGTSSSRTAGTSGWAAPEVLMVRMDATQRPRLTEKVDIWSLGCVIHYTITTGHHPFDPPVMRDSNIFEGKVCLSPELPADAALLIKSMIAQDSESRPSAKDIMKHPFFWSTEKRLTFLSEVSDAVERDPKGHCAVALEKNARCIIGNRWDTEFPMEAIGARRRYCGTSVRDLLRFMRNTYRHAHDVGQELRDLLGATGEDNVADGVCAAFDARFPKLLCHTYQAAAGTLAHDHAFLRYFMTRDVQQSISQQALPAPNIGDRWMTYNAWSWSAMRTVGPPKAQMRKSITNPRYRTELCCLFEKKGFCSRRQSGRCDFAHGVAELRLAAGSNTDTWDHTDLLGRYRAESDTPIKSAQAKALFRTKPCKYFPTGECKNGDECGFSHDACSTSSSPSCSSTSDCDAPDIDQAPKLCRFYSQGSCRNGDECAFLHEGPAPVDSADGAEEEDKCEEPLKACRFYSQGSCRNGEQCPFLHQGSCPKRE